MLQKQFGIGTSMNLMATLDRWLYYPGDSHEKLELKRYFFLFTAGVVPPVIGLTFLTYWLDVPVLQNYGWMLLTYYTISILAFLVIKTHVTIFYYFNALVVMGLTFYTMTKQGGIMYSGGIEYSNLAIVIFAFVFYNKRLAFITTVMYIAGIIFLSIFQGHWKIAPEMAKGSVNLVFTSLNSIWISIYILMVIVYIFNRRTKEEQQKLEKMKEIDEMKSRLFTNITHEFRTPLTMILGMSEHNNDQMDRWDIKNKMKVIKSNASRLLRLVNQMLGLSRIEAGMMDVNYSQVEMMSYLGYLLASYESLAQKKSIQLHFLKRQEQIWMDVDLQKTEDIFLNLIHNAIKFTPQGGNIYVVVGQQENSSILEIEIKDTGIGISENQIPHIFDRFYQINDETQPITEGSGIGLTLVKEYVQILDGTIAVKSAPGAGTSFFIRLPISNRAKKTDWKEESIHVWETEENNMATNGVSEDTLTSKSLETPHVLIVEDNPELASYLQKIISGKFSSEIAVNGEEGIHKAIETIPDLIVSDIMMPVKDGYELCKTLKADFRTNHIPIILLTAMADTDSKLTGYQKGADAYLYKPFKEKELLIRMEKLVELRKKLELKFRNTSHLMHPLTSDAVPTGLNERFMQELTQYLDKNYQNENFGIQDLCLLMNISRVQLHRKLTALTGLSASHFINKFRIEKAAALLNTTRKTIAEISFEVGFSDPGYFSKVFAKHFGLAPVEFRSQQQ